jgi:hypothetical protein
MGIDKKEKKCKIKSKETYSTKKIAENFPNLEKKMPT